MREWRGGDTQGGTTVGMLRGGGHLLSKSGGHWGVG